VVVVAAAILVAFFLWRRRASADGRKSLIDINLPGRPPSPSNLQSKFPSMDEVDTWTVLEDVEIKEKLGGGNFGEVYRGVYRNGDVALKKLKGQDQDSFVNEAAMLGRLKHPNVVQYLGVHTSKKGEKYIVMEYLSLGSLPGVLKENEKTLNVMDLVAMAKQAAAGMLHLENLRVIHRDLALRNILVTTDASGYIVKISDFGLSRSVENAYFHSEEGEIPIKWSAPEVLEYGTHTSKSDVYSFGILLWELFSYGKLPYPEYNNDNARIKILEGVTPKCPPNCPPELYKLMQLCWSRGTEKRPTFKQIFAVISQYSEANKDKKSKRVSGVVGMPKFTQEVEEDNYGSMKPISRIKSHD